MNKESIFRAAWRLNKGFPLAIATLLVLNIVAFALLTFLASPRINALERQYISLQNKVREGRQAGREAERPQTIYRQGKEDLKKFWAAIPPQKDFTALIGEIFSLAKNAGLAIDQITYTPKEEEKGLLSDALSFTVTGKYEQVKKFIFSLEQSKRLIALEQISLSGGEQSGKEQVSLHLKLSTYFRTEAS
jgi:type IV pilus assembly protein PilO